MTIKLPRLLTLALMTAAMALSSCRTAVNESLHVGKGEQITAETTIEKLKETAEQCRVQKASIEKHPEFTLGTIEFNDEGLSFSREQRQAVMSMIREEAHSRGAILVAFIHGWKHNAAVCDANLSCFRSVLKYLGQREGPEGRRVIGVYLGWRGLTYCNPVGQQFSFWTRKRIGERLGTNQARRTINDLLLLHNEIKRDHRETRFVAVGHSLGAGVLFSAVGPMYRQALHDAIADRKGTELEPIQGFRDVADPDANHTLYFPDLVVLANPAFEAELYKRTPSDLAKMRAYDLRFSTKQLPLLISVSSEADTATRFIFPVGQTLRMLFSPVMWLRGFSYLKRNVIAAANYGPYVTDLASTEEPPVPEPPRSSRPSNCYMGHVSEVIGGDCGCNALSVRLRQDANGNDQAFNAKNRIYGKVKLERLGDVDANNPFIVATATRAVLRDHNDIFNPIFMSLLIELMHKVDEQKSSH